MPQMPEAEKLLLNQPSDRHTGTSEHFQSQLNANHTHTCIYVHPHMCTIDHPTHVHSCKIIHTNTQTF